MRYYIIAGERSGDQHGNKLISSLKIEDPQANFRFWGGEYMEDVSGQKCIIHYNELTNIGLDFLSKIFKFLKLLNFCKKDISIYKPDAVILIDYSGFNLYIAKYAKQLSIRTYYFIAPKIWASRLQRIKKIKTYIHKMFTIFPFEEFFFKKHNYKHAFFVGNPTVTHVNNHLINKQFRIENNLSNAPIVALIPGSRLTEVKRMLPLMVSLSMSFPNYQFVVAAVYNLPSYVYDVIIQYNNIKVYEQTYDLLAHAHGAIVTSGTATLEAALYNVPQVVVYKTSLLTYIIFKKLIQIPYISLVNILANQFVVEELIQQHYTKDNLTKALYNIMENQKLRLQQQKTYLSIKQLLGNKDAAVEVAHAITTDLKNPYSPPIPC